MSGELKFLLMQITGTHFNYHQICHRKLWLFANGIQMEHTSEAVSQGKLIHETSYRQRSDRFKGNPVRFPSCKKWRLPATQRQV
jgi:CRISPR/Cas system-associated exonuclease Cas4 (RecB family)